MRCSCCYNYGKTERCRCGAQVCRTCAFHVVGMTLCCDCFVAWLVWNAESGRPLEITEELMLRC